MDACGVKIMTQGFQLWLWLSFPRSYRYGCRLRSFRMWKQGRKKREASWKEQHLKAALELLPNIRQPATLPTHDMRRVHVLRPLRNLLSVGIFFRVLPRGRARLVLFSRCRTLSPLLLPLSLFLPPSDTSFITSSLLILRKLLHTRGHRLVVHLTRNRACMPLQYVTKHTVSYMPGMQVAA
jgi:hypothetical protein